jgi:hypothetical protein
MNVRIIFADVLSQGNAWFMRQNVLSAFLRAVGSVMQPINDSFGDRADAINERLRFTGQTISLEYRLNDVFDASPRRIFIENIDVLSGLFIRRKSESATFPIYLRRKSEGSPPIYLRRKSEISGAVGFIVHVPDDLGAAITESRIRNEVDRYRAAGTVYSVIFEPL